VSVPPESFRFFGASFSAATFRGRAKITQNGAKIRLLLFFSFFFICLLVSSVIPAYPKDLNEFGALEGGSGSGRLL